MKTLFPFQQQGLEFLLNSPSRHLYLADDMGLGKTVQGIAFANAILARKLLVICPASLRLNWVRELTEWGTIYPQINSRIKAFMVTSDLTPKKKKRGLFAIPSLPIESYNPVVISYNLFANSQKLYNYIYSKDWDLVILDEAQAIRGHNSKQSKAVLNLWLKVPRVLCMSGTPMMNSAIDLYPPLSRIVPSLSYMSIEDKKVCSNFRLFADKFVNSYEGDYGMVYKGVKNSTELARILKTDGKFFIRRRKTEVLKDLPDKMFNRFDLPIKANKTVLSKENIDILNTFLLDPEIGLPKQAEMYFAGIRRELGEAKALCLDLYDIIDSLIQGSVNKCLVIFFYHHSTRDVLKEQLTKRKHKVVLHDGTVNNFNKQKAVDDFQNGNADIFLAQSEAATGYTVTRANDCLFIEYPWLPSQLNQAIDRIHRIGQKNSVTAHFVVADNDTDKGLVKMLITKQKAIDKVIER